ncbi:MAG: hypothetical protein AAB513_00665 [Patescibacteria group bacterium]
MPQYSVDFERVGKDEEIVTIHRVMENRTCVAVTVDEDVASRIKSALEILEILESLGLPTDDSSHWRLRELINKEEPKEIHHANAIREIFNLRQ